MSIIIKYQLIFIQNSNKNRLLDFFENEFTWKSHSFFLLKKNQYNKFGAKFVKKLFKIMKYIQRIFFHREQ